MKVFSKIVLGIYGGVVLLSPVVARGTTLSIEGPAEFSVGEVANIDLVIDTEGESINAVSGALGMFNTSLRLETFHDGVALLKFWLEKPQPGSESAAFSGIIPGGFSGKGILARFVVRARESGTATLALSNVSVRRNDGAGTELSVGTLPSHTIRVVARAGEEEREEDYAKAFPDDLTPPEPFAVEIVRDEILGTIAVFAAQDKGSGVSHYEVEESFFGVVREADFVFAESPYVVEGRGYVFVKAVDNAGNARVAEAYAGNRLAEVGLYGIILLAVLLGTALARRVWKI